MWRAGKLALAGFVFLVLAAVLFGYHAARWLAVGDAPIEADSIVVLAGRYERSMYAADLYRRGYARRVVLSDPVRDPVIPKLEALGIRLPAQVDVHRQVLRVKGVADEHIEVLPGHSISTADEAAKIAAKFAAPGARLIVVTSPYHVRRTRLIIGRALEGSGAMFAVCATLYEDFPDAWWTSQDAAREVLLEWAKIVWYLTGGRFRASAS